MLHRNSQKRIYEKNKIYFITTVTYQRWPYFEEEIFCRLLLDVIQDAVNKKKMYLYGYVILHEHIHLLTRPINNSNISCVMQYIKKHFSRNANLLIKLNYYKIYEGEICKSRLHINKHIINAKLLSYYNKIDLKILRPFKWQKSFHDHIIRNKKDFNNHINYIKQNPIKHEIIKPGQKYKWIG